MFCIKCGRELQNEANFCSYCGTSNSDKADQGHVNTGNSSINIGVGNLPNANIHIGDNIAKENEVIEYQLHKTTEKRIPIKAWWAVLVGALGILGSIASIYSVVSNGLFSGKQLDMNFYFIFPISMLILVSSGILTKTNFIWLQYFGFDLDKEGFIRFIRLKGKCPLCTGNLNVRYSGPEGARSIGVICSRNPEQHRFTFDPTWLDEI